LVDIEFLARNLLEEQLQCTYQLTLITYAVIVIDNPEMVEFENVLMRDVFHLSFPVVDQELPYESGIGINSMDTVPLCPQPGTESLEMPLMFRG